MVWVRKNTAGADSFGNTWPNDGDVIDIPLDEAMDLVSIKDGGFSIVDDYQPEPEPSPAPAEPDGDKAEVDEPEADQSEVEPEPEASVTEPAPESESEISEAPARRGGRPRKTQ